MGRLEINMQVHAGFSAGVIVEGAGDDGSRKARLVVFQNECFGRARGSRRHFQRRRWRRGNRPAADHNHVGGYRNADGRREAINPVGIYREPVACIQKIRRVFID